MQDSNLIDQLAANLKACLPDSAGQLGDELEYNMRAVLREGIARLDLITREEFDIQQQVLARTRAKLEALESRVSEWEQTS